MVSPGDWQDGCVRRYVTGRWGERKDQRDGDRQRTQGETGSGTERKDICTSFHPAAFGDVRRSISISQRPHIGSTNCRTSDRLLMSMYE